MRVALLTQWFGPHAKGLIGGFALSLSERGAQVCVVTGDLEPRASAFDSVFSSGRKRDFFGLPVMDYPYFHSHDDSAVRRLLTYATFSASSLRSLGILKSADVVLAYGSPATATMAALAARKLGGPPFVLMVQDVWPDSIFSTGFVTGRRSTWLAENATNTYIRSLYANASQITANSPSMRELLVSRGADPQRTHVVYNWSTTDERPPSPILERVAGRPLELMYAGNIGPGQDLGNVLAAMSLLPQQAVRLTVVGDGVEWESMQVEAQRLGLSNVRFLGRVSRSEMVELMPQAHMHLVPLRDTPLFSVTIPSKFQSLLAAGMPVLSVAPGEVARMVRESGAGVAAPPGDPQGLADLIQRAAAADQQELQRMGRASRGLYDSLMTRRRNADTLYEVVHSAASEGSLSI